MTVQNIETKYKIVHLSQNQIAILDQGLLLLETNRLADGIYFRSLRKTMKKAKFVSVRVPK